MDYQEIRTLMTDFSDSDLTEFELEEGGLHLRMARAVAVQGSSPVPASPVPPYGAPTPPPFTGPEEGTAVPTVDTTALGTEIVKAPLVGIYYAAPSPGAEPFVRVGQPVHRGQVLCIIEAMKAMNEVKAPCDGTVFAIRATDGGLVSYDDPIIEIAV